MMKHILKLFVLATLCAALTLAAAAATETGSCGTGLTYTLDTETGVMTISGEGWLGQPQTKNKKAVRTLVIAEGVKNIQMSAFHGYTELRSVTLPTTLDFVASYAFAYCPRLEAVHIRSLADFAEVWFDKADSNPLTAAHHRCGKFAALLCASSVSERQTADRAEPSGRHAPDWQVCVQRRHGFYIRVYSKEHYQHRIRCIFRL